MKGPLFHIGQAVITKDSKKWLCTGTVGDAGPTNFSHVPKSNEIVHVASNHEIDGKWYITLKEYPPINGDNYYFHQNNFVPVDLVSDSVLEKELSEIFSEEIAGVK